MSELGSQNRKYLADPVRLVVRSRSRRFQADYPAGMLEKLHEPSGHLRGRQDDVHQAGADGAPGHAVLNGRALILHQHHSVVGLDFLDAEGAVRAGAGQYNRRGVAALI